MDNILHSICFSYILMIISMNITVCIVVAMKEWEWCIRAIHHFEDVFTGWYLYKKYLMIFSLVVLGIMIMLLVGTFITAIIGVREW